jgi:hypothetical protein
MVGGGTAGHKVTGGTGGQGERREVERCRLCVAKKIQSNGRSKRGGGGGGRKRKPHNFGFWCTFVGDMAQLTNERMRLSAAII